VEVEAPAGFLVEEVVANDHGFHGIDQSFPYIQTAVRGVGPVGLSQRPPTIASPRIEGAVVAGFANRVVGLVEFDDVAAPGSIPDADRRPRHVVNEVMTHSNPLGARNVDPGNLLPVETTIVNEIVASLAFVGEGALRAVSFFQVAYKANGAISGLGEFATAHRKPAIVIVDEHGIAADGVEPAGLDRAVSSPLGEDSATSVNRPVAQGRHFVGLEVSRRSMG